MASKPRVKRKKKATSSSSRKSKKQKAPRKHRVVEADAGLETALKFLREGRSQRRAAEIGTVSVRRFRRFLREHKLAKRKNGRWVITDRRIREIEIISQQGVERIRVRGFGGASLGMRHRAAVQKFLDTNDVSLLAPFEGKTVNDALRQKHALETRPNVLYRIANAGSDADMKIYRLI